MKACSNSIPERVGVGKNNVNRSVVSMSSEARSSMNYHGKVIDDVIANKFRLRLKIRI